MAACLSTFLFACHRETEQEKVKAVITNIQKASEEKDVKQVLARLAKSYQDPQGFDRESIKALLVGYFFRHQKVHAYIPDIAISIEGTSAKAEFQAVLTGGTAGSAANILPESLGVYAFDVSLRKEENEWMVVSARWNKIGEDKE